MAPKGASPSSQEECGGGVPPGRLRETSVVSLLSNPRVARLGARIAGLCRKTVAVLGQSGAFALGRCHLGARRP